MALPNPETQSVTKSVLVYVTKIVIGSTHLRMNFLKPQSLPCKNLHGFGLSMDFVSSPSQLSQACSDRKKSPSEFDNKIVNCSHQTTIFH